MGRGGGETDDQAPQGWLIALSYLSQDQSIGVAEGRPDDEAHRLAADPACHHRKRVNPGRQSFRNLHVHLVQTREAGSKTAKDGVKDVAPN